MRAWGVAVVFTDEERIEADRFYKTKRSAEDAALEIISNWELGAELLHMSNPGDNPMPYEQVGVDYIEFWEVSVDKSYFKS